MKGIYVIIKILCSWFLMWYSLANHFKKFEDQFVINDMI